VKEVGSTGITLREPRDKLDADRFRDWARDKVVARIPGSGP
jgi:hypothetical protein